MSTGQDTALTPFMGSPESEEDTGLALTAYRAHKAREQGLCQSLAKLTGELEAIYTELQSIDRTLKGGRGKAESEAERRSMAKARVSTLRAASQTMSLHLMTVMRELKFVRGELGRHERAVYGASSPGLLKARVVSGSIPATLAAARIDPKFIVITEQDVLECNQWEALAECDENAR
jgi:hypothetical protein